MALWSRSVRATRLNVSVAGGGARAEIRRHRHQPGAPDGSGAQADGGGGVSAVASHLRHKSLQTASRYIDRRGATSRALNALES